MYSSYMDKEPLVQSGSPYFSENTLWYYDDKLTRGACLDKFGDSVASIGAAISR
jgi:hypothetical protein